MSTVNRSARDIRRPILSDEETAALRALLTYTANEGQQRTAVTAIMQTICETNGLGWHDDARLTDFAQGKRSVGLSILSALVAKPQPQETK
jgi:hypothetical protein